MRKTDKSLVFDAKVKTLDDQSEIFPFSEDAEQFGDCAGKKADRGDGAGGFITLWP
jgi:hypothetical protein